jgi:hypothetical protein
LDFLQSIAIPEISRQPESNNRILPARLADFGGRWQQSSDTAGAKQDKENHFRCVTKALTSGLVQQTDTDGKQCQAAS